MRIHINAEGPGPAGRISEHATVQGRCRCRTATGGAAVAAPGWPGSSAKYDTAVQLTPWWPLSFF
jgi:hypothetical protein